MDTAPEVIQALLVEASIGVDPSEEGPWPIFVNQLLDKPDKCIVLTDNPFPTNGRIHRTGETISVFGYQVRIRAGKSGTADAKNKAFEISQFFDSVRRQEIIVDSTVYTVQGIHQETLPVFIGQDANDRPNFTINGRTTFKEKD
jgi:hypothetical protein